MLRIVDWDRNFESSESRKIKGPLTWVRVPIKMSGVGYTALLEHANGTTHFGAWIGIVEVAASQDPRGILPRAIGENPHSIQGICKSVARISRMPLALIEEVMPRLIHEVRWVEEFGTQPADEITPIVPASRRMPATGKPSDRFQEFWGKYPRKVNEDSACRDWCTYVTADNEELVFACLERYLCSRDVSTGAVRSAGSTMKDLGWIASCARDGWKSDWPAAQTKPGSIFR